VPKGSCYLQVGHAPCNLPGGQKTTGFTPVREHNNGKGNRALLPIPNSTSNCRQHLGTPVHIQPPGPLLGSAQVARCTCGFPAHHWGQPSTQLGTHTWFSGPPCRHARTIPGPLLRVDARVFQPTLGGRKSRLQRTGSSTLGGWKFRPTGLEWAPRSGNSGNRTPAAREFWSWPADHLVQKLWKFRCCWRVTSRTPVAKWQDLCSHETSGTPTVVGWDLRGPALWTTTPCGPPALPFRPTHGTGPASQRGL
jgi:hypothetical protein